MEMTLTVHVPQRRPHPVDVVVRWSGRHTAADLCARLADHLGMPVDHLTSRGRVVGAGAVVGEPPLLHGAAVTVATGGPAPAGAASGAGVLELVVVGGPDAGHARPLSPPAVVVGRAPASGLRVDDDSLSRVHATFRVGRSGVVVEDAGSTNGVLVDGRRVRGPTAVDSSSLVVVGSSTLRLRRAAGPGVPLEAVGDGRLVLPASPTPATGSVPVEVECPRAPAERHRARVPWVAALVPIPVGVALALVLGPQLLAFALLGPVMLLAGALSDRWGAGRAARRDAAEHARAVTRARARLDRAVAVERARLDRAHPDSHAVLTAAEHPRPGLWGGDDGVSVRLGVGDVPTRVTWVADGVRDHPVAPRTPVVVPLAEVEVLGVVGPDAVTDAVLRSVTGQVGATQPPSRVGLAVASTRPEWRWAARLPHAVPPPIPAGEDGGAPAGTPAVRVLVVPAGDVAAAGPVASARSARWLVVLGAPDRAALPGGCGAVLTVGTGPRHVLETTSGPEVELVADGVGAWWADRVSRALAPLRSAAPTTGTAAGPLPDELGLDDVLAPGAAHPAALVAGWAAAAARGNGRAAAVAAVGRGPHGIHTVDLERDGPHLLVGGTTGSGKSEFLRTLVTSLAVSASARDVSLVLVDFKGGSAFGPCAGLPHVVGLVTDLDDHLVSRALTSLQAELRRRERLLADAGAQDLNAYARSPRGRREPVPRLVVVVDELRTLVDEVPDFVSGLVRLAAQGRSLGIHLVLATQRPAGAVTAEVQANVSLRIAFRVRDRADSVAVVDDGAAADIDPRTPGRAVARGADGRLHGFQSAILGRLPSSERPPTLEVIRVDDDGRPADPRPAGKDPHADQAERAARTRDLVAAIVAAHRIDGATDPRRPWLPPLPERVTVGAAAAAVVGAAAREGAAAVGLVDEPDLQRVGPLTWHPDGGTWLLPGRPRSGRTTALRALIAAAARVHVPQALHVHVVDPAAGLDDIAALPHVGTHVRGPDRRALVALVDHLRGVVAGRRAGRTTAARRTGAAEPTVLVAVDGWEQLVETHPETLGPGVTEDLVRVLRDGAAVGVVGAVTGGRALLQPRWAGLAGTTVLLGALDPLDLALAGLRAADVPQHPPPGRGIRLQDGREVQLALVECGDVAAATPAAATAGATAWRHRPLPERVPLPTDVPATAGDGHDHGAHPTRRDRHDPDSLPLGLFGEGHDVWCWVPARHGRALLVAGPARSGRSNALAVLAHSIASAGRPVVLVSRAAVAAAGDAGPRAGILRPGHGGAEVRVVSPFDVDSLVAARRQVPGLAVLVDDADLIDETPVVAVLHEVLDLVDRDEGLVAVVSTSSHLATRFRGLDVAVARRRSGLLLQPGPADADLLGAPRPHSLPAIPGRGVFVGAGSATEVQVYLAGGAAADGSADGTPAGNVVVGGRDLERGHGGHRGDPEDHPAHEGLVALDEPEADGHEERAPHDGRRPGPVVPTEPAPRERRETEAADEDEHGRHEHPPGVAALADDELVDVEGREADERGGLDTGEDGREAARAG